MNRFRLQKAIEYRSGSETLPLTPLTNAAGRYSYLHYRICHIQCCGAGAGLVAGAGSGSGPFPTN